MYSIIVNIGSSNPKYKKPRTINIPKGSMLSISRAYFSLTKDRNTRPPSRGGIGSKLNIIKTKLIKIPV